MAFLDNIRQFHRRGARLPVASDATSLDVAPSASDVINAIRLILGRTPEPQADLRAYGRHKTVADLRAALLATPEFHNDYTRLRTMDAEHPDVTRGRATLVFIHLLKTGGTSLRTFLQSQFEPERACPIHWNNLHQLSVAELSRFDYYAGHFDYSSIRLIPRDNVRIISLFRRPSARLISWYRALRSYPPGKGESHDRFVALANSLGIEEFFEQDYVRQLPETNNYYLMAFGRAPSYFGRCLPRLSAAELRDALATARSRILALHAIGITERFAESAALIASALGMTPPGGLKALNVTDELPRTDARCRPVDPVSITPRLAAALSELTRYDDELYDTATAEFQRRLDLGT